MNKKTILASLIELANDFDNQGMFAEADGLTDVSRRLAQYDDDFGDYEPYERPDYETHEENELIRDREYENGYGEGNYETYLKALESIRNSQANEANVPYFILIDDNTDSYDIMSEEEYELDGSHMPIYERIGPGSEQDLMPYYRGLEDKETPLGMELDGGIGDVDF